MNLNKTKSFEEFLNLRKFSIPNENNLEPENFPNANSLQITLHSENPENNEIKSTKNNRSLNKNFYDSNRIEQNMKNSKVFKEKNNSSNKKKHKNEELRVLKLQAMEKERFIEKRRKAVIIIQKFWRGYYQYIKFQAFKYILYKNSKSHYFY